MTAHISAGDRKRHGIWNGFIMTNIVWKRCTISVWMCVCVLSLCGLWASQLYACICLYACLYCLKGLAPSRSFVVGGCGHSAQLVRFVNVSQNCISLRPEKGCPSSRCETPTNVPTLTALNRNSYKLQICLTRVSCCQFVNNYINVTQKESGKQMKCQHANNKPQRLISRRSSRWHLPILKD